MNLRIQKYSNNQVGGNSVAQTGIDRVAGLYVYGPAGVQLASAGRDLKLSTAEVSNSGSGQTDPQNQSSPSA